MKIKTQSEIMKSWGGNSSNPLVSICCATFNQVDFIESAIKGFLIQRTDFPFEIIIRDDCSSDGTVKILKKYKRKYPTIIRLILENENQFQKGVKPSQIFFTNSDAKYIAMCDGDDYWVDPTKLTKQVDFLENNADYVMVGHSCINLDYETGEKTQADFYKKDGSQKDLILGIVYAPTLTRVFRNIIPVLPIEFTKILHGDVFISAMLGVHGKYKYLKDIKPAIRLVSINGLASKVPSKNKSEDHMITFFWLYRYFKRMGLDSYAGRYYSMHFLWFKKRNLKFMQNQNYIDSIIQIKNTHGPQKIIELIDGKHLLKYANIILIKKIIKKIFFLK
jgi:glycosyltransferase involved in cell wall biosynthesis